MSLITWLVTEKNGLLHKKNIVFYFVIKIPNLNLYCNQNSNSMFPNFIDPLGCQKRETKPQQTNEEKLREK